jgi:hypothetical protein
VYDRQYGEEIFTFEPSGGLINASLVMQDKETDSYWSIMTNQAIFGNRQGIKLKELPIATKIQWEDWVARYPKTLVLSVDGEEDATSGYTGYFNSPRGFNGLSASDSRLATKESVFAFEHAGQRYAVSHEHIEGGKSFELEAGWIFLYRPQGAEMFYSTIAFKTNNPGFSYKENSWVDAVTECIFDSESETFISAAGNACPKRLNGIDTFWYTWSLTNPDTQILE